ncbi:hypothetical protein EJ06DRAFT_584821 [Trichodelitschia bisporula]|uniref:GDP/GTP exchange factor Sec2 N-terminal domain-containing protein n=1 Tax=Trichodelitschia bisporula TaxID=703511 RepID=A0A6G1HLU2_9PEZI|nr:hypothetical protein EJ06DRAFT_584821 [Trichodelitschia bisporula]
MSAGSLALAPPAPTPPPSSQEQAPTCPHCAAPIARIAELEAQVRLLTEKATSAVDKLADYEDELRRLKSSSPRPAPSAAARISSLLMARKTAGSPGSSPPRTTGVAPPTPPTPGYPPPLARTDSGLSEVGDLQSLLARERGLRAAAEGKLSAMSGEMEDLSAALFQQANEMVAAERRARARLEERVEVLERRDGEKRARLERLEGAVRRIERVRGVLERG